MIYADKPRKYATWGWKWSHIVADSKEELLNFAKENSLKRKDLKPYLHYDVTDIELKALNGKVKLISDKEFQKYLKK